MPAANYLLDNADAQTAQRFRCLSELYDPIGIRQFDAIGVRAGWRCLDVGAGGGSVAQWLAHRVSPSGTVLATDVDTRWLTDGPALTVTRRDLTVDPLPVNTYDLIHARLVLMHLPRRDAVLASLCASLRPGGWLVVGELDPIAPYVPHPRTGTDRLVNRVGDAFTRALAAHGADNARGWQAHRMLLGAGLVNVTNEGHVAVGTAGSPAADLMTANVTQVGPELVATGALTQRDVDDYLAALRDADTTFLMPVFFSAKGRRP